jgi:hypothetical protein
VAKTATNSFEKYFTRSVYSSSLLRESVMGRKGAHGPERTLWTVAYRAATLQEACKSATSWTANGLPSIRMGVNLFEAQFREQFLVQNVRLQ